MFNFKQDTKACLEAQDNSTQIKFKAAFEDTEHKADKGAENVENDHMAMEQINESVTHICQPEYPNLGGKRGMAFWQ